MDTNKEFEYSISNKTPINIDGYGPVFNSMEDRLKYEREALKNEYNYVNRSKSMTNAWISDHSTNLRFDMEKRNLNGNYYDLNRNYYDLGKRNSNFNFNVDKNIYSSSSSSSGTMEEFMRGIRDKDSDPGHTLLSSYSPKNLRMMKESMRKIQGGDIINQRNELSNLRTPEEIRNAMEEIMRGLQSNRDRSQRQELPKPIILDKSQTSSSTSTSTNNSTTTNNPTVYPDFDYPSYKKVRTGRPSSLTNYSTSLNSSIPNVELNSKIKAKPSSPYQPLTPTHTPNTSRESLLVKPTLPSFQSLTKGEYDTSDPYIPFEPKDKNNTNLLFNNNEIKSSNNPQRSIDLSSERSYRSSSNRYHKLSRPDSDWKEPTSYQDNYPYSQKNNYSTLPYPETLTDQRYSGDRKSMEERSPLKMNKGKNSQEEDRSQSQRPKRDFTALFSSSYPSYPPSYEDSPYDRSMAQIKKLRSEEGSKSFSESPSPSPLQTRANTYPFYDYQDDDRSLPSTKYQNIKTGEYNRNSHSNSPKPKSNQDQDPTNAKNRFSIQSLLFESSSNPATDAHQKDSKNEKKSMAKDSFMGDVEPTLNPNKRNSDNSYRKSIYAPVPLTYPSTNFSTSPSSSSSSSSYLKYTKSFNEASSSKSRYDTPQKWNPIIRSSKTGDNSGNGRDDNNKNYNPYSSLPTFDLTRPSSRYASSPSFSPSLSPSPSPLSYSIYRTQSPPSIGSNKRKSDAMLDYHPPYTYDYSPSYYSKLKSPRRIVSPTSNISTTTTSTSTSTLKPTSNTSNPSANNSSYNSSSRLQSLLSSQMNYYINSLLTHPRSSKPPSSTSTTSTTTTTTTNPNTYKPTKLSSLITPTAEDSHFSYPSSMDYLNRSFNRTYNLLNDSRRRPSYSPYGSAYGFDSNWNSSSSHSNSSKNRTHRKRSNLDLDMKYIPYLSTYPPYASPLGISSSTSTSTTSTYPSYSKMCSSRYTSRYPSINLLRNTSTSPSPCKSPYPPSMYSRIASLSTFNRYRRPQRDGVIDLTQSDLYLRIMSEEDGRHTGGYVWNPEFLSKCHNTPHDSIEIPSASVEVEDIVLTEEDLKLF